MKSIKGIYKKINLKPNFRLFPFYFMKVLNGPYVKFVEGVSSIDISRCSTLIEALKIFQSGESRLIVTFRHPTKHDPPILMRTIHTLIPRKARKDGVKLNRVTHGHFVYGKWLMMWANNLVKWLFPGIGAIPVNNRSRDLEGIRTIREILNIGDFPLFIAPEGQVTYHNEKVAPLEGGVISMAQWCRDDLDRSGSLVRVHVLPVTLYYDYTENGEKGLIRVINKIRRELDTESRDLIELTQLIISRIEDYYTNFHFSKIEENKNLNNRIDNLVDIILKRGEVYFNLDSTGDFLNRTLTIRQAGLSNIDFSNSKGKLPSKDHGDHIASECYSILRHMEIADLLQYIDPVYIDNGSLNRRYEYSLNLLDLINRFNGGTIGTRFSGLKKKVIIKSGEILLLNSAKTRSEKRAEGERLLDEIYSGLLAISSVN